MTRHQLGILIQFESDDPELDPDRRSVATVERTKTLRRAVMRHLKNKDFRVVSVFHVEHIKLLMQLHEAIGTDIARAAGLLDPDETMTDRPPPDYEPPPGKGHCP